MSGALKSDLFFSDKLHLVEKGNFILAKSIYTLVKNHHGSQNNYQLSKTYKPVTAFSLNALTFLHYHLCLPVNRFLVVSVFLPINWFIILLANLFKSLTYLSLNLPLYFFVNVPFIILFMVLGMNVSMFL